MAEEDNQSLRNQTHPMLRAHRAQQKHQGSNPFPEEEPIDRILSRTAPPWGFFRDTEEVTKNTPPALGAPLQSPRKPPIPTEADADLLRTLWEKEAELADRDRVLRRAKALIAERERSLQEQQKLLEARERFLRESEKLFREQQQQMRAILSAYQSQSGEPAIERQIPQNDDVQHTFDRMKEDLDERESRLRERETLLAEREKFIEESESILFEKAQELQEREAEVEQREETFRNEPEDER